METKRTRRSFSPEFKKQAVQRVLLLKEPATNVSAELEIKPETLSKWIKDYEKMVAEDPSYAAAGAPKRPVIKLAKKKTAPDTNESLEVQPENPVAQESVPTA
ncbi:transposase, partial [Turicimonas muris]